MTPAAPKQPQSKGLRTVAIIPARAESRRLPRKMLLAETGRCLFEHTVENVAGCSAIEQVVVATDSPEIMGVALGNEIYAVLTRTDHPSGTDRIYEALRKLGPVSDDFDVVLNVQGDEPDVSVDDLTRLIGEFADPDVEIATLCGPVDRLEDAVTSHVVKVVYDQFANALYFSRSPIPHRPSDPAPPMPGHGSRGAYARDGAPAWLSSVRRHIGVYAFRPRALEAFCTMPRALEAFCTMPPGRLESIENLEQLRWIEAGRPMRVVEASHVPLGIDTQEDYERFVELHGGTVEQIILDPP